jgi:23S rRNA (adenine2503-C2)-methyltransferase
MPWLADYDPIELEALLRDWGHNPVHARRLLRAFYDGCGGLDPDALPLPAALRERLRSDPAACRSTVAAARTAADGTTKLLVSLHDGAAVEAVLMPGFREDRAAGCVSSQVGCAMGCDFCASTRGGLERNLHAGEIVEQFLHLKRAARGLGRRLTSLVLMGMGEPMHNLDQVIPAIRRICDAPTGALGWRQVTVSTVGVVPGIDRLTAADLNVNLALSLHAPDDATRARIVPSNRRYPVAEVMAATRRFAVATGRIPTIEYCLLAGVNDSDEHAGMLADLVSDDRFHVNLIPYNPIGPGVSGAVYRRPAEERVSAFLGILRDRGVVAHVRATRGDDVDAACGQLRETAARLSLVR